MNLNDRRESRPRRHRANTRGQTAKLRDPLVPPSFAGVRPSAVSPTNVEDCQGAVWFRLTVGGIRMTKSMRCIALGVAAVGWEPVRTAWSRRRLTRPARRVRRPTRRLSTGTASPSPATPVRSTVPPRQSWASSPPSPASYAPASQAGVSRLRTSRPMEVSLRTIQAGSGLHRRPLDRFQHLQRRAIE